MPPFHNNKYSEKVAAKQPQVPPGGSSWGATKADLAVTDLFPQNLPNSEGSAAVAATASTTFTFKKNGTSFATMNFAAAASVATFTQASDTTFVAGDVFTVDSPASDLSLSNVGVTLAVTRN